MASGGHPNPGSIPHMAPAYGGNDGYQWAYSIMDSSRVSTFFISILLIVYGSFRSLALEDEKDGGENVWTLQLCFD